MNEDWIAEYLQRYKNEIQKEDIAGVILQFYNTCLKVKRNQKKMIFAGNGASASIASHFSVDFSKQGHTRSINFNEGNLITCLANDYGYEHWVSKGIELYADQGDVVCLISSSGKSPNMVNAAQYAKSQGLEVITFTGFANDNPLKAIGDINFWVNSRAYNIVECIHMIWGTTVVDMLVGQAEYSVN